MPKSGTCNGGGYPELCNGTGGHLCGGMGVVLQYRATRHGEHGGETVDVLLPAWATHARGRPSSGSGTAACRASCSGNSGSIRGTGEMDQDQEKAKCTTTQAGAAALGGLGTDVNGTGPVDACPLRGCGHRTVRRPASGDENSSATDNHKTSGRPTHDSTRDD